jgi:hypothetical protein
MNEIGRNLVLISSTPAQSRAVTAPIAPTERVREFLGQANNDHRVEIEKRSNRRLEISPPTGRARTVGEFKLPRRERIPFGDSPGLLWQTGGPAFTAQQLAQLSDEVDQVPIDAAAAYRATLWREQFMPGLQAHISLVA